MRFLPASCWLVLLAIPSAIASAAPDALPGPVHDDRATVTFVWENDRFGGTDRNYTNGNRFSWLSGTQATDGISEFIARRLVGADETAVRRRGFALGHSIFTPDNISSTAALADQHPYAGWLYGEVTGVIQQRDRVDQFAIQIGLIGPSAGGEWVQNEFHALIGADEVMGWDNQLDDELTLAVSYDRKLRRIARIGDDALTADLTPNLGATLGTVYTTAQAGLTLRVGEDLQNDFGPPRIRPSLAGVGYFTPRDGFSWYFFAGAEGRLVAFNRFLDGSLWTGDPATLSRRPFIADYQFGAVVQVRHVQIAFTYVDRDREFDEQIGRQKFGAVSLSRKF